MIDTCDTITSPETLPRRAHNLALRVLQLAKEPGEYQLTIIVHPDGRWQLKPPPKIEDLG